ncbi:ARHGB factor, partial [Scytalopus superciliaris]|nr:ARHGB factor [Scytalopus superciliaris]
TPLPPLPRARCGADPRIPVGLQDPEVQKHATQILRNMLRQEEAELQRCQELYSRNPGAALEEQLEGARRRVSQLQLKILQETGNSLDSRLSSDSSRAGIRSVEGEWFQQPGASCFSMAWTQGSGSALLPGRLSLDSQDWDSGLESGTERFPSLSEERTGRLLIIGPEEDCDPGYFNNECDSLFQDLSRLKARPAHLGVFLRYILSQADPSPLLFYLCTEVFQQSPPKDSRALGKDIWNIFLDRSAPLRVKVPEPLLAEIGE